MKCIKMGKPCIWRGKNDMCSWNCPLDGPGSECPVAQEMWGCPWVCGYEPVEDGQECPYRQIVKKWFFGEKKIDDPFIEEWV
jgi:hypothetical protein